MKRALSIGFPILLAIVVVLAWIGYRSGDQAPIDVVALAERELGIDLDSSMVAANGIRLHVIKAGRPDGPPLVLLHGYPEFWWGWRKEIPGLVNAGFRVIIPDGRGYNDSDKPEGVEAYRPEARAQDIISLVKELGYQNVNLAGHDMGAGTAWLVAIEHPELLRKLMVFSVGHPLAYAEAAQSKPEQETISWYRTFFQLPALPELVGRFGNWHLLVKNMRATSRQGTFSDDEMNVYRYAWDHDNAMHYMVNWYRAGYRYPPALENRSKVRPPTKIVWGQNDAFSEYRVAELSLKHCEQAEVTVIPDTSHWLLHEEPVVIAQMMSDFFKAEGR